MTALSQLIKDRESFEPTNEEDFYVFGVEVDCDDVTPPRNVREIGLLARTEDGELTNEVLDATISYILAGMDVLIEFPADVEIGDARHLMATAASVQASLSFLPPKEITDETFESYCQRLEAVTSAYLRQLTMTKFVMPITNYLQYCYIEVLDPEASKTFVPEDGYVISRFHESMSIEQSDLLKQRIRKVIFDHFGGSEEFRKFALGLMGAVSGAVETTLVDVIEQRRQIPVAGWYWLMRKSDEAFVMARFDGIETWSIEQEDGTLANVATSSAGRDHILIEAVTLPARHSASGEAGAATEPKDATAAEVEGEV
jgi:hypothetical protein